MANPEDEARGRLLRELRAPLAQIIDQSERLEQEAEQAGQERFVATLRKIVGAARRLSAELDDTFGLAGAQEIQRAAAPPGAALRGRLLLADGDASSGELLSLRFEERGYSVQVARDGRRALEMIDEGSFDLVLLDATMPDASGLQVLHALRRKHPPAELPVIMLTAGDQSEDVVGALKAGANDYLGKPLDLPVVLARIDAHLALKRANGEIRRLASVLEVRNQFIRSTFGRYLSEEIVTGLLEGGEGLKLGGQKRTVTVLMSDLRGFTSATEGLPPEAVVGMLNSYLAAMVDVIAKHQGTIDEFIGDAILVLFGAPVARDDDARRAVACAVEMQLAMASVNERFRREWLPEVEMGIAINTGPVVVGNIGSLKRAKYGVVGSHVNLAARIESFTVGGQILVSEHTLLAAGPAVHVGRQMDIQAKGFKEVVALYELKGIGAEYKLFLPEKRDALVPLARALPVRYTIAEDKAVGGPGHAGSLVALGDGVAELRPERPLRLFTNLQMRVQGPNGEDLPGDVYAKVAGPPSATEAVLIHFTTLPRAVRRHLEEQAAAGERRGSG